MAPYQLEGQRLPLQDECAGADSAPLTPFASGHLPSGFILWLLEEERFGVGLTQRVGQAFALLPRYVAQVTTASFVFSFPPPLSLAGWVSLPSVSF